MQHAVCKVQQVALQQESWAWHRWKMRSFCFTSKPAKCCTLVYSPLSYPPLSETGWQHFWCCFQFGCLCSHFRFLLLHCCCCCCCLKVCHFRLAHAYNFCLRLSPSRKQYRVQKKERQKKKIKKMKRIRQKIRNTNKNERSQKHGRNKGMCESE